MKYFTIEWWSGEFGPNHMEPFKAYEKRIEEISSSLPHEHQRLLQDFSLHDSHLLGMNEDFRLRSITLSLDILWFDEVAQTNRRRKLQLCYGGVENVQVIADPDKGLPGPHGYGDLGYDELDLSKSGLLEHRILFSSGINLTITHKELALELDDCQ